MKLVQTTTIRRKVEVEFPDPAGTNKPLKETFFAHYRVITSSELKKLRDRMITGEMSVREVLDEVLEKVDDIQHEDGTAMASDEALESVKENIYTATAALNAWHDLVNPELAGRKNSPRSSRR